VLSVWRICAAKYQDTALEGIGGLYVPGRWHTQGHQIVYTAQNLSLASLEVFVHLESDRVKLIATHAKIPEKLKIEEIKIDALPSDWQTLEQYSLLQELGRDWLISERTPVLKVPSAIVPVEHNYLLNPKHPDFEIWKEDLIEFRFDQRMWKSKKN